MQPAVLWPRLRQSDVARRRTLQLSLPLVLLRQVQDVSARGEHLHVQVARQKSATKIAGRPLRYCSEILLNYFSR